MEREQLRQQDNRGLVLLVLRVVVAAVVEVLRCYMEQTQAPP